MNNKKLISQDELKEIMYNYLKPELDKCDEMGGRWRHGSQAGAFYWFLFNGVRHRTSTIGSRLIDKHWEIYNDYFEEKNVNIIVYKDHIEFNENSKFEDFSRDEMYSLYEFLKDKIFNNKEETKEDENVIDIRIIDDEVLYNI